MSHPLKLKQGPKRPGERIYKGHKSYDLMLNLQLGIRFSVGGMHARTSVPILQSADFQYAVRRLSHWLQAPHLGYKMETGRRHSERVWSAAPQAVC